MLPLALGLGLGALGAYQNYEQAKAQKEAQKQNMLANAEAIRYSPWTHMSTSIMPGQAVNPTGAAIGGAAQGALSGLQFGQQFGGSDEPDYQNKYWQARYNRMRGPQSEIA